MKIEMQKMDDHGNDDKMEVSFVGTRIDLKKIKVQDDFWTARQQLIREVVIPYQEKILNDEIPGIEKSHALANFRIAAGMEEGAFYGMVFQDSDVAKWLEGVAYALCVSPDASLEARADAVIDMIAGAQQPDGYLDTYFIIKEPEHKWQNLLECHELYCAGHMMEAAAAYYEATGKRMLLDVACRLADHIDGRFGPGKCTGIPGHQEIEIGLMRLYQVTGSEKYAALAQYFIDERGRDPEFFQKESAKRGWVHFGMKPEDTKYNQSFLPVREQETAEGHSVRAVYMYTAMADIAAKTGEKALADACERLWNNITGKRMYVTGGIGSTVAGEAFTVDYDLPNDTVYAETCAAIGLVFFARKMLELKVSGKYSDVMERALYNGVLSGMQMDGRRFFYVNPLEVNQGISGVLHGYEHVLAKRPEWYTCACCPPNVVRLVMSLGKYAWGENEDTVFSHLYLGGEACLEHATVSVKSRYPSEGDITYQISPSGPDSRFKLAVRIPAFAKHVRLLLNGHVTGTGKDIKDGYCYIDRIWTDKDTVQVLFDMPARRIYANTAVRADAGCVCLMRGPVVYCFESIDNGGQLSALRIPEHAEIKTEVCREGILKNLTLLKLDGVRMRSSEALYSEEKPAAEQVTLTAVPYFSWGNRDNGNMRVWMLEK